MDKILEAFLPKLLTERVLLIIAFMVLFAENYLLISGRGNIAWLNDKINTLSVRDVAYFLVLLALSWVFVFPFIRIGFVVIYSASIYKPSSGQVMTLSNEALLSKAIRDQNSVAYQHFENHIKHVKSQRAVSEMYFYLMMTVILNLFYKDSFIRVAFGKHPFLTPVLLLAVVYLGLTVGIAEAVSTRDGLTDVPKVDGE